MSDRKSFSKETVSKFWEDLTDPISVSKHRQLMEEALREQRDKIFDYIDWAIKGAVLTRTQDHRYELIKRKWGHGE